MHQMHLNLPDLLVPSDDLSCLEEPFKCILKYSNIFVNFSVSCINSLTADPASFTPFYWKAYTLELSEPQLKGKKNCTWLHTNATAICMRVHTVLCSFVSLFPPLIWSLPGSVICLNFNDAFFRSFTWTSTPGFSKTDEVAARDTFD